MIKKLSILGFALVVLIAFSGCGKKQEKTFIKYQSQFDQVMNDTKPVKADNNDDINFDL